ncbi:MAG: hypothetical protein ACI4U5_05305 [Bacilli bacterium]
MLDKVKKNELFRMLFEVWIAGIAYFLFTNFIQLFYVGVILFISVIDYGFLNRKNFLKNLIINAIIYFSYDFLCNYLFNTYELKLADAVTYMLYYFILNYVIFERILNLRDDRERNGVLKTND